MKFGIFYELQLPRPWTEASEYGLFQQALGQMELADRLGYDYVWMVEHHFLEEYSHCSAPEVFLGAASQRTKRIRLGHGVVQLTTNQPQRVAERSRRSTSFRAGASISAWARRRDRRSCIRSASACATSATGGRRRCAPSSRCSRAPPGSSTASTTTSRRAT